MILHIGHVLSVEGGKALGLDADLLTSTSNLVPLCEEDNLGLGKRSIHPITHWLLVQRQRDKEQNP